MTRLEEIKARKKDLNWKMMDIECRCESDTRSLQPYGEEYDKYYREFMDLCDEQRELDSTCLQGNEGV